jgi:hypothetical protein
MSQEVNPYLVTSVSSAIRMPDEDYAQNINLMKEKYQKRINANEKAKSTESPLRLYNSTKKTVVQNGVLGKHRAHHHSHHQNHMYDGQ